MRSYLDHAATTPVRPEALDAMLPFLGGPTGNPSGMHASARAARQAVDDARERVAALLGAAPGDVIFTSGGTEADNLAVHAAVESGTGGGGSGGRTGGQGGGSVVCSAIEHAAVLRACRRQADRTGAALRLVPAGADGIVDLDALGEACDEGTVLVAVMAVNNEVGSIQPIADVATITRSKAPGAALLVDAVQAVPWTDAAPLTATADLVAVSAHKFGGPMGVGALVARGRAAVAPLIVGGGQERDRRAGTPNVAGIAGMAAALAASEATRAATVDRVAALRDRLVDGLVTATPSLSETGDRARKVAGNAHVTVAGIDAEELLVLLDAAGVDASSGSSCASGAIEPSHVLVAMGMASSARSGLRLSLGWTTTAADVDLALEVVPEAVARLED